MEQENAGPASARNKGISLAKGEYVAFLDADDIWLPHKLEEQMKILSSRPEVALVYSQMANFDEVTGKQFPPWPKNLYSGRVFDQLLVESFVLLSSVVIRSSVLREVGGFDEGLATAEDTNLFIRIARKFDFRGLDAVQVRRRIHDSNLSERVDISIGTLENLDRLIELFPETDPRHYPQMKKAYVAKGTELIREYFHKAEYAKCHDACEKVKLVSPRERAVLIYWFTTLLPSPFLNKLRKVRRMFDGLS